MSVKITYKKVKLFFDIVFSGLLMGGFYSSDLYKKFKESGVGGVWWHANVRGARLINSKLTDELADKDKLELSAMLDTSNAIIKKTGLAMRYASMVFRLLVVALFPLFHLIYVGNSNVYFLQLHWQSHF